MVQILIDVGVLYSLPGMLLLLDGQQCRTITTAQRGRWTSTRAHEHIHTRRLPPLVVGGVKNSNTAPALNARFCVLLPPAYVPKWTGMKFCFEYIMATSDTTKK